VGRRERRFDVRRADDGYTRGQLVECGESEEEGEEPASADTRSNAFGKRARHFLSVAGN
jgi:hypothetical protein